MSEKSHVGMFNCFFCGEPAGVLLDRRLKPTLPHNVGAIDREPCQKCKDFMAQGVILISVDESKTDDPGNPYRTGGFAVVKAEVVTRIVQPPELAAAILKQRVAFVPDEVWNRLGLPALTPQPEGGKP